MRNKLNSGRVNNGHPIITQVTGRNNISTSNTTTTTSNQVRVDIYPLGQTCWWEIRGFLHKEMNLHIKAAYYLALINNEKKIHSENQHLLESQIHLYFYFRWREYPHDIILQAWTDTTKFTREQLLKTVDNTANDLPVMFITTYNRANPNFKELISRHWTYLGRSNATRDFEQRKFMVTYRRPPSLKDQLVRARITQPTHPATHGCKRPNSCKYCKKISQSGKIKITTQ